MGCVVPYVCREYEKNGQSFFVPFSIKVPRFMHTISRFLFYTRECELWLLKPMLAQQKKNAKICQRKVANAVGPSVVRKALI